jgi:cyanuric acid amidohydrolase
MPNPQFESKVIRVPMSSPGDVSEVAALFDSKAVDPAHIVAIMEQTEGDPYARGYATLAMEVLLSERLHIARAEVFARIPMMMIGGVGGIMSPHINLFIKEPSSGTGQGKGKRLALGVAVATGEVERSKLADAMINVDKSLFSSVASTSAGGEQVACRVLVIGNVEGAPGKMVAAHGVMQDQLDIAGARKAFAQAGLEMKDGTVVDADRKRIAGVLVNAGADYVTNVRGRRHVLHSDFLAPFGGIQAKAVAHAVVATIVGDTMFLASAGAEHQGPPGANLVCVIAEAKA